MNVTLLESDWVLHLEPQDERDQQMLRKLQGEFAMRGVGCNPETKALLYVQVPLSKTLYTKSCPPPVA